VFLASAVYPGPFLSASQFVLVGSYLRLPSTTPKFLFRIHS
jgi:hypothetical protein